MYCVSVYITIQPTACSPPRTEDITENNKVGDPVLTIPVGEGVIVELNPNPNPYFTLDGNVLRAAVVFDYEVL